MNFGKVAVLCGGTSSEREISLLSGKAVCDAFASIGVPVASIDAAGDFLPRLRAEKPGVVFIALHGAFGEDGTVQELLEAEGFAYTGSGSRASRLAFDKAAAQAAFRDAGVPIPRFEIVKKGGRLPAGFSPPYVVKPARSGSSVGVTIVRAAPQGAAALDLAFRHSEEALVEEYVDGRELTVGFLGDEPLPVVEVTPGAAFYDYEAKYKSSDTRYECPAKLTRAEESSVVSAAATAYRASGCEVMARADVMLRDGRPYVLELNTIPGLTGKSLLPKAAKAAGIDFPSLCVRIVELSLNRVRTGK